MSLAAAMTGAIAYRVKLEQLANSGQTLRVNVFQIESNLRQFIVLLSLVGDSRSIRPLSLSLDLPQLGVAHARQCILGGLEEQVGGVSAVEANADRDAAHGYQYVHHRRCHRVLDVRLTVVYDICVIEAAENALDKNEWAAEEDTVRAEH